MKKYNKLTKYLVAELESLINHSLQNIFIRKIYRNEEEVKNECSVLRSRGLATVLFLCSIFDSENECCKELTFDVNLKKGDKNEH